MKSARILIVEDQLLLAKDIAAHLRSWGHEVVGAAVSGEEAIAVAGETRPDLIIMDICLRGPMDGVETAARITARYDVAIVYLTAHAEEDIFERAKHTNPYGFLGKPVAPRDLQRAVEMAIYRHSMERELKASREILELALEGGNQGLWDWNLQTGELRWHERTSAFLGFDGDMPPQRIETWRDLVHPDDRSRVNELLDAHIFGALPLYECVYRMRTTKGNWIRMHAAGRVTQFDEHGRPLRMTGTCKDVTESLSAAETISEANRFLRSVFASLREAVLVVNRVNRIVVECNRAAEILFGFSREHFIGMRFQGIGRDAAMLGRIWDDAEADIARHGSFAREYPLPSATGRALEIAHYAAPIEDRYSSFVVHVFRDREENKQTVSRLIHVRR